MSKHFSADSLGVYKGSLMPPPDSGQMNYTRSPLAYKTPLTPHPKFSPQQYHRPAANPIRKDKKGLFRHLRLPG